MTALSFKLCPMKQRSRQRDRKEEFVDFTRQISLKENRTPCQTLEEGARKRKAHSSLLYLGTADPSRGSFC